MDTAHLLPPTIGGLLIGLGAALLLAFNGRIAGISGIFDAAVLGRQGEAVAWRWLFLVGLVAGGALALLAAPGPTSTLTQSTPLLIVAGVLVGFGTKMANGCTSGHGVCGNARLSARSIVATLVFMGVGAAVVAAGGGAA